MRGYEKYENEMCTHKHVRCLFLAEIQMQSNIPYTSGVSYARALTPIPNPVTLVDELLTGTSSTTGEWGELEFAKQSF